MESPIALDKKSASQEVEIIIKGQKNQEQGVAPVSVDWKKYDSLYRALMDYFELDVNDFSRYESKIDFIKEWTEKKAESKDRADILLKLKELEKQLEPPSFREKRIVNVYRWMRLEQGKEELIKEQKVLEKEILPVVEEEKG